MLKINVKLSVFPALNKVCYLILKAIFQTLQCNTAAPGALRAKPSDTQELLPLSPAILSQQVLHLSKQSQA